MKYYDPQSFTYYEPAPGYTPPASHILQPETPTTTPTTPAYQPGQPIEDFTRSFDGSTPTSYSSDNDYKYFSEQDFYDKTGQKDFSQVEEIEQGQSPTSAIYKYKDNAQVYGKRASTAPNKPVQPAQPVGTSESERAKKRAEEIAKRKAELEAGTVKPTPFDSLAQLDNLRQTQGIVKDQTELNTIQDAARQAQEELNQFKQTSSAGLSQGGYLGGISEAERNMNFRLNSLALREQAVIGRINASNAYINQALAAGQQTYNNAKQAYDDEYSKNVKAIELYNADLDDQQKDALTGFTTITNLLKESNITEISPQLSAQLDTFANQLGLEQGSLQEIIQGIGEQNMLKNVKIDSNGVWLITADKKTGIPSVKLLQNLGGSDSNKVLSPTDAAKLGVPYGTTQGEAARMGINPTPDLTTEQEKYLDKIIEDHQKDEIINTGDKAISAVEIADQVIANPKSAGNQLKILYTLVKNLDPDSAVREGELDLASQTQSYFGKFETNLRRISEGQLLSPEATIELANATKDLAGVWVNAAERRIKGYNARASVHGVENAWNNYAGGSSGDTESKNGQIMVTDPDGGEHYFPNQESADQFKKAAGISFNSAGKPEASKKFASTDSSSLVFNSPAPYGIINGYDITSYATDPKHERNVFTTYQNMQKAGIKNTSQSFDGYIQSKVKGSPVKGQDIIDASKKFNVDPMLMVALMQIDSSFGTAGKAVRTRNPGNVGNTDSGGTQGFKTWRDGVFAVAQNLSKRRAKSGPKNVG